MSGRPINEDRQLAILMGNKTYIGAEHARCGTTERYVSGGGCVHCARVIATEQREARRFLKQHEAEVAEHVADQEAGLGDPDVNHGHIDELDDADAVVAEMALPDELRPPSAADRFRHDIDELM